LDVYHTSTHGVALVQIYNAGLKPAARGSLQIQDAKKSLYAIARPSSVCLSSVTFVRPTQAVQIFGNISTALGTLAIR